MMQESTAETQELPFSNSFVTVVVCRLCTLSLTGGSMEPNIFLSSETGSIAEKIASITRLTLYEGDGLPTTVCQQCLFQLNMADRFIQKCLESNQSLMSRLIQRKQTVVAGGKFKSSILPTPSKQAMQTVSSEDFLLALEYVEETQEFQGNDSLNLAESQVPQNVSVSEEDLEVCAIFDIEKFSDISFHLDEVDDISLSMEEYSELSIPYTTEDPRVCNDKISIASQGAPHANLDGTLRSVENQSEPTVKEIAAKITETKKEAKTKPIKRTTSTDVVAMVNPLSLTSCPRLASGQLPQETKQSPITTQKPNGCDRKLRKRFSDGLPVLNVNNQPRLPIARSRKQLGTLKAKNSKFACDKCSSEFASNTLLKWHTESQDCKHMHLGLQKMSIDCLKHEATVAQGTPVIHSTLEPNMNCVDPKRFKCTSCSRSYKARHGLNRHIREKHLAAKSSENKFD